MSRQPLMLQLKQQGLSMAQIAERLRVTEAFVRRELAYWGVQAPAKPHGNKAAYQRQALEIVLKRKEREAVAIANSISNLRQQIEQMSAIEATGKTLRQALKGARS